VTWLWWWWWFGSGAEGAAGDGDGEDEEWTSLEAMRSPNTMDACWGVRPQPAAMIGSGELDHLTYIDRIAGRHRRCPPWPAPCAGWGGE
jgi:hypothetical protein